MALLRFPGVLPVMFTLNKQLLLAATVPPVRLKLLAPVVGEPPQVFTMFGGFATARPNGKLSPTLMPLRDAVTLGFVIVKSDRRYTAQWHARSSESQADGRWSNYR